MALYIKSKIAELLNPVSANFEPIFRSLDRTVFKIMGVSMFDNKDGKGVISVMWFLSYSAGCVAFTFSIHEFVNQTSELTSIMQSAWIFFASINLMLMWICLLRKYTKFRNVVQRVIHMSHISNKTPNERQVGLKFRRIANVMHIFLMVTYAMSPLTYNFHMVVTWGVTGNKLLPVHIPIWGVPYDSNLGYTINLIWIWVAMCIALGSFLAHDVSLFMTLVGVVARLEVIKETYITKIGDKSSFYKTELAQYELLKKIIRELNDIYNVIIDINDIYVLGLFSNFFNGTMILCAGYTQLLLQPHGNAICIIPVYTAQLFFYSYFGELLVQKNVQVSTALYCSQWYNMRNISSRKMFHFMLMRSQRPFGLQVGGFGTMNLEIFTAVHHKVYGVVTFVLNCLLS